MHSYREEHGGSQNLHAAAGGGTFRTGHPELSGRDSHFSQKRREVGHRRDLLDSQTFDSPEGEWSELLAEARRILRDDGEEDEDEGWPPEYEQGERLARVDEEARQRRIYRGRTVAMLRRYMRYSMETGRLPSILGREFFRAKVTSYTVVTFEDRVIFVHDMERCLDRLDEFSRELIARHILQEHDRWATAKLLHCNEKTVRRLTPMVLDVLSEILLDVRLMDRLRTDSRESCQGGFESQNSASDWEDGKNKF